MRVFSTFATEEHVHGDTRWVAIRARGAEWSWLTPEEAAEIGRHWMEKYGGSAKSSPVLTVVKTLAA